MVWRPTPPHQSQVGSESTSVRPKTANLDPLNKRVPFPKVMQGRWEVVRANRQLYPSKKGDERTLTNPRGELVPPWEVREERAIMEVYEDSLSRWEPFIGAYVEYVVQSYKPRTGSNTREDGSNGIITLKNVNYVTSHGELHARLSFATVGREKRRLVVSDIKHGLTQEYQPEETHSWVQLASAGLFYVVLLLVLVALNEPSIRRLINLPN